MPYAVSRRRLSLVIAIVLVVSLGGIASANTWHTVKSSGGFSVAFPAKPTESTQQSTPITLTQYVLQQDNALFMATWNDAPASASSTPEAVLHNMREGVLRRMPSAYLRTEKKISIDGHPGRELTLGSKTEPDMIVVARLYLVNKRRLYMTMVVNETKAGAAARAKFLGSFKLTGATRRK